MKDISQLDKSFSDFISRLRMNIVEAQEHATDFMLDEAKDRIEIPEEARNTYQFIEYSNSLKTKKAQIEKDAVVSSVYSDLLVGGDDPKWADVPVGAFLEWGTGPLGENTNSYDHGYDYTTLAPWDRHTWLQQLQTGTWGIMARPHLYPALIFSEKILEENIKEAIKEAWTE